MSLKGRYINVLLKEGTLNASLKYISISSLFSKPTYIDSKEMACMLYYVDTLNCFVITPTNSDVIMNKYIQCNDILIAINGKCMGVIHSTDFDKWKSALSLFSSYPKLYTFFRLDENEDSLFIPSNVVVFVFVLF